MHVFRLRSSFLTAIQSHMYTLPTHSDTYTRAPVCVTLFFRSFRSCMLLLLLFFFEHKRALIYLVEMFSVLPLQSIFCFFKINVWLMQVLFFFVHSFTFLWLILVFLSNFRVCALHLHYLFSLDNLFWRERKISTQKIRSNMSFWSSFYINLAIAKMLHDHGDDKSIKVSL